MVLQATKQLGALSFLCLWACWMDGNNDTVYDMCSPEVAFV